MKLSLCLATHNEEANIHYPLDSCIDFVDEVIIVDGRSSDKTVEIAKSYGSKVKVYVVDNPPMFHINKQKALDLASGDWILQLDADEEVSPELAKEIRKVIGMTGRELREYENDLPEKELFLRNENVIARIRQLAETKQSDSKKGGDRLLHPDLTVSRDDKEPIVAFYLPRLNYFLGRFLRYGGQYPDGSIRLVRKGKAHFPCKDVHEVMAVDGGTGWLQHPLLHYDSPTFGRYIERNNRYIDLMVRQYKEQKLEKNFLNFLNMVLLEPLLWFFGTQIGNKGVLDGWQGIVFSFFSALRFPRAYIKYLLK